MTEVIPEVISEEILDSDQLMNLSKPQIVAYCLRSTSIVKSISELSAHIQRLTTRLEKTESELAISKNTNNLLCERIDCLEKRLEDNEKIAINNAQYLRRRQLEVSCKLELENGDHLKGKIAEILSVTGTTVRKEDIDICHKLGTKGKSIILELKERHIRDSILRTRKFLKNIDHAEFGKIYISESLCDSFRRLDFACRRLKKTNQTHSAWFFNGRLWLKQCKDSNPRQISHITDLYTIFGKEAIDTLFSR